MPNRRKRDKKLAAATINSIALSLRRFFKYLFQEDVLLADLGEHVPRPVYVAALPKYILSREDIEKICSVIPRHTLIGYRDRLLVEILYNTGLRLGECLRLRIADIDLQGETIFVQQGKMRKDRVVPLTAALKIFLREYVRRIRPYLAGPADDGLLIVAASGGVVSQSCMNTRLRTYGKTAGLAFHLHSHMFRHAFAVHLMREGCDIKYISLLLGHVYLSTTQIYTAIEDSDLREKFRRFHFYAGESGNFVQNLI